MEIKPPKTPKLTHKSVFYHSNQIIKMRRELRACEVLIVFCFFIEIEAYLYQGGEYFFHNDFLKLIECKN